MAKRKRGSGSTPGDESERPRAHKPPEGTRPRLAPGRTTHRTVHAQTPAGPSTRDSGVSFPDVFGPLKVLTYLLSYTYQKVPARHRSKLVVSVAAMVTLLFLGWFARSYWWWIAGVPHVHITFHNNSDEPLDWPRFARANLVERRSSYPLEIRADQTEAAEDRSAFIEPRQKLRVRLAFPRSKDLYQSYQAGGELLVVKFYRNSSYRDVQYALPQTAFNQDGLAKMTKDIGLNDGRDALWERPGICVYFETAKDDDPNAQTCLESFKKELEEATEELHLFWLVSSVEYIEEEQRFATGVKKSGSSSDDGSRSIVARVTISGYRPVGARLKWIFDVKDAQNKISDGRVLADYEPAPTTQAKEQILTALQRKIVQCCGIAGQMIEVRSLGRGKDYEAILDIGSYMGVREGMTFDVLSPGTDNMYCGTVEIKSVPEGPTGARGRLTTRPEFPLNESSYMTFEHYRVQYPQVP